MEPHIFSVGTQVVVQKDTYSGYVASQFKKMQTDIRNQGRIKWKHVTVELEREYEKSTLPEMPSARAELNELLVRIRLNHA